MYEAVQTAQGAEIRFARGFGKYGPEESSEDESDEDGQVDDAARTAAFRAALDAPRRDPRTAQRFHEAGWDAHTTGVVYVRLLEKGTSCENRLHLMRSVYEIDLGSDESIEPVHPTPKGEAYHVRVDDENTDVRALLTSLGASDIHHVQKCNDDSREWCVDVSGELTGDSAVPWACFEAERDALLHQKAPSTGSWPKKAAKKASEDKKNSLNTLSALIQDPAQLNVKVRELQDDDLKRLVTSEGVKMMAPSSGALPPTIDRMHLLALPKERSPALAPGHVIACVCVKTAVASEPSETVVPQEERKNEKISFRTFLCSVSVKSVSLSRSHTTRVFYTHTSRE